jgi:glycosyltransferase involved in cell wall biosynthesis
MRIGQNPAKFIDHVAQPQKITVALITYIPFLEAYYSEGLDILKTCLESIWQNTNIPYDLLVFDNNSCPEVRNYLTEKQRQDKIQLLTLSDKNIGKGGAWNYIFGAAPGEYIAYADSDVYFYPGWISNLVPLFELFPNLGMVTGAPLRVPEEFSTSSVEWAISNPLVQLERGRLLAWEDFWKHVQSLGIESEAEARTRFEAKQDVCLVYKGVRYFIGASHFQFMARKAVLQSLLPLPSDRPMGQMRALDIAINQRGYLRISTPDWWVQHMGNTLQGFTPKTMSENAATLIMGSNTKDRAEKVNLVGKSSPFWSWKPTRKVVLWFYNKAFNLLYRNKP